MVCPAESECEDWQARPHATPAHILTLFLAKLLAVLWDPSLLHPATSGTA